MGIDVVRYLVFNKDIWFWGKNLRWLFCRGFLEIFRVKVNFELILGMDFN